MKTAARIASIFFAMAFAAPASAQTWTQMQWFLDKSSGYPYPVSTMIGSSNVVIGSLTSGGLFSTNGFPTFTCVSGRFVSAGALGNPTCSVILATDISGLATSATTDTTNATNITSGTLATNVGGTGLNVFTRSGNTTSFATSNGTLTSGDCVSIDANGNFIAAGGPCTTGGGGGTVNAGTAGQIAYYGTSSTTISGNPNITISSGSVTLGTSGVLGSLNLTGNTSGVVSILPQAAAGTYNFNLPTTAGASGSVLTSAGGGSSPMTWTATGTSGAVIPLLNGTNTWANAQTFSVAPVMTTLTGHLSGNGASAITASATIPAADITGLAAVATSGSASDLTAGELPLARNTSSAFPGLSANVQSAGQGPGLDQGTWFIWQRPDEYTSIGPFRTDRHMRIGCPGDTTGATCGSSNDGFQSVRNNYTLNASTNPDNAQWEWGESATFYNSARPGMAAQNGAGGFQNHKIRAVNNTSSASGTGSSATVTFNTSSLIGSPYVFPVGYDIYITGMTPSGYNGLHTVTASSPGSVSFSSATTGSQTVAGELGHALTSCTAIGGNLVKFEYSHPGVLVPFTSASGTGSTATLTFDTKYSFSVNDEIVVTGAGAYNGTHTITAIPTPPDAGWIKFASAATGTTTGTITASQWRPQETVRIAGVTGATGFNGKWKIYGTSATTNHPGPGWFVIDYGSAPSCAGFANGFVNNISVGPSWGGYATCTDKTGVDNPGVNSSTSAFGATTEGCVGTEIDVIVTNQDGDTTSTDANESRVILDLAAVGQGYASHPHIGVGLNIKPSNAILDKAIRIKSPAPSFTFGTGIDFTDAIIDGTGSSQPAIEMKDDQEIIFSGGTADATRRSLRSSSGILVYRANSANRWQINDAGTMTVGVRVAVTAALPTLSSCGTSPSAATGSSNNAGQITVGTGTPTACTVTFNSAYASHAFCTVTPATDLGSVTYYISASSSSAFTITAVGGNIASEKFNYTCFGN